MIDLRRKPISDRLASLLTLKEGWAENAGDQSGYRGEPMHVEAYHDALHMIEQIERCSLTVQRVMPRINGGVNLEWDFLEAEIEVVIEFDPPPEKSIYMTVYDGSTHMVSSEDSNRWEPSIDYVINTIRKYSYLETIGSYALF